MTTESTPNLTQLMETARQMQDSMKKAHDELSRLEIVGSAGAGMVQITMNGRHEAMKVVITEEAMKETNKVLAELIKAAVNDVARGIEKASQDKMLSLTKDLNLPLDQIAGK